MLHYGDAGEADPPGNVRCQITVPAGAILRRRAGRGQRRGADRNSLRHLLHPAAGRVKMGTMPDVSFQFARIASVNGEALWQVRLAGRKVSCHC
jgi:hypothetical protein